MRSDKDRVKPTRPSPSTLALKRALDVAASALGLLLLSPIFVIVIIIIKLDSPGPAFFRQERVGRYGRPFRIFKFRSMVADSGGTALTVRGDKRVTRVGAFLRKTKLDELPQLINVLAGDMAIVGPRPEVPEFMRFYTPHQRAIILSMRPGITDYAAILFRNESALIEQDRDPVEIYRHQIMPLKFACYRRYSHEISVRNDLHIIFATLLLLVAGRLPAWLGIDGDLPKLSSRNVGTEALPHPLADARSYEGATGNVDKP